MAARVVQILVPLVALVLAGCATTVPVGDPVYLKLTDLEARGCLQILVCEIWISRALPRFSQNKNK